MRDSIMIVLVLTNVKCTSAGLSFYDIIFSKVVDHLDQSIVVQFQADDVEHRDSHYWHGTLLGRVKYWSNSSLS